MPFTARRNECLTRIRSSSRLLWWRVGVQCVARASRLVQCVTEAAMMFALVVLLVPLLSLSGVLSLPLPSQSPSLARRPGTIKAPWMGWSSWCTKSGTVPCVSDFCNEAEILSVAAGMQSNGMQKLGFTLIQLDDCWAGTNRTAQGAIQEDLTRFPHGIKAMISKLHAMGFLFALYTDIGERTCRGGRLGSWPHYAQDAATFAEWGVDMVKCDWCDHPAGYTAQQLYTNLSHALTQYAPNTLFSICEWGRYAPWTWAPAISNAWRVGPDHLPRKRFAVDCFDPSF